MNIQSISIVTPTKGCINKCKFCVSCMHGNKYENNFDYFQIEKRIKFGVNNQINTAILTGTGECLQNCKFLNNLLKIFKKLDNPFPNIEFQTTGVMLMEKKINPSGATGAVSLLKHLGVNTISLSISDIDSDERNMEIIGVHPNLQFKLEELCKFIKDQKFNLRLSLNMTKYYDSYPIDSLLSRCKELGADQITFRKLYHSNDNSEQTKWVKENKCFDDKFIEINNYIKKFGNPLYKLPFGPIAYSIKGMSIVVDDDCMSKDNIETLKYIILRENGKLYCRWDDEGSLIF